jgi:steroid delta-isomerase
MSDFPTRDAMEATLNAYVDRVNAGDAEGVLALFAPGAVIEDPIGSPAKSGEDLPQWFADAAAFATRITPVAPIRGSHADEALLIFDVEFTPPQSAKKIRRRCTPLGSAPEWVADRSFNDPGLTC